MSFEGVTDAGVDVDDLFSAFRRWRRVNYPVIAVLLALSLACSRSAPSNPAQSPQASNTTPPLSDLTPVLERALVVTGSATHAVRKQESYSLDETWGEWTIDLTMENRTDRPLRLDSTLIVVETDDTNTAYHGYVLVRNERLRKAVLAPDVTDGFVDHAGSYEIDEFEAYDGRMLLIQGRKFHLAEPVPPEKRPPSATLQPGGSQHVKETVKPYSWFIGAHRTAVLIVLPEIHVGLPDAPDSYQPVAVTAKQKSLDSWGVERVTVLHETAPGLSAVVEAADQNVFLRVLAANRLAEYYPDAAGPAIAKAAATLREGNLLACLIDLAKRIKTPVLADHCRELVADKRTLKGIAARAKAYLKAVEPT
jgi:hypothetical protein